MKRVFVIAFAAAAALTLGQPAAHAQYGYGGWDAPYYQTVGTAQSAAQHGFADIVRSAGVYNLLSSEALGKVEDARKKYIENRLLWTQTYFEMQRINAEYRRAQYERDKRSAEDLARYAQMAAPKRLSSSQLDPITGYLAWPRLLMTPAFNDLRRELDALYAERANTKGAIGNEKYFLILDRVDQMQQLLRGLIKRVPAADYIDASRFLESLGHEARYAAG
jgi:hypothetical protein